MFSVAAILPMSDMLIGLILIPVTYVCRLCNYVHWQAHECRELELQAWNVIIENFDAVADNPEFLDMTAENLLEIIKYDDIQVN